MKQTSIIKLSQVYNELNETEYRALANLVAEVIRSEESKPVKGSKFDIFKYTMDDKFRPQMHGVFHDNGYKVASDSHVLIAIKSDYTPDLEGKILLEDGSFVEDSKYPKWQSVIPDGKDYKPYQVDAQKFYEWIEQKRAQEAIEGGKRKKWLDTWKVKVGPALIKAEFFDRVLTAMKEIGATDLFCKDSRRAVYTRTDKGIVVQMPLYIEGEIPVSENILDLA
jgi:hypothetical protein